MLNLGAYRIKSSLLEKQKIHTIVFFGAWSSSDGKEGGSDGKEHAYDNPSPHLTYVGATQSAFSF